MEYKWQAAFVQSGMEMTGPIPICFLNINSVIFFSLQFLIGAYILLARPRDRPTFAGFTSPLAWLDFSLIALLIAFDGGPRWKWTDDFVWIVMDWSAQGNGLLCLQYGIMSFLIDASDIKCDPLNEFIDSVYVRIWMIYYSFNSYRSRFWFIQLYGGILFWYSWQTSVVMFMISCHVVW